MTTSQTAFLSEINDLSMPISAGKRAYFQERFRNRLYDFVIDLFEERKANDPSFTQATLAKRIGKRPEQINRWLSAPSNLEADTISDLVLGILGAEPTVGKSILAKQPKRNSQPQWLKRTTSGPILVVSNSDGFMRPMKIETSNAFLLTETARTLEAV